ncbi:hypothetical protein Pyn_21620 [Prunus yedoensis var. nudiflora]|uniref:Uncharacterized protein n=1 Tax=Prunus yedoensis var. nudiflora TaxID=2094558 RepID=A0A314ZLT0_PRUYE|nr:hypothetical protein Pyn_21620 [Prunus yedoensis var. nudiflora]
MIGLKELRPSLRSSGWTREVLGLGKRRSTPYNSKELRGRSPSHGFVLRISGEVYACGGGLTRKEIKEMDDSSEYSKTRENQAIRIFPPM